MATEHTWWLRHPDGTRVRIAWSGVLIGRAPRCEVVVADPKVSRRHALVYLRPPQPILVPLSDAVCKLNGAAVEDARPLEEGARIGIASVELETVKEHVKVDEDAVDWVLEHGEGRLFGVTHTPYFVGGGDNDDLVVDGASPSALVFYNGSDRLSVEAGVDGVRVGDVDLERGNVANLKPGVAVSAGALTINVVTGGIAANATTERSGSGGVASQAIRLRLEFLPRGGRLTLEVPGQQEAAVYLPERRCDLMAALLHPPEPYTVGALVPDHVVVGAVWPGKTMGREELNVLVFRLRRDLLRAGLDGVTLIERAAGGTRVNVPAGSAVVVE